MFSVGFKLYFKKNIYAAVSIEHQRGLLKENSLEKQWATATACCEGFSSHFRGFNFFSNITFAL